MQAASDAPPAVLHQQGGLDAAAAAAYVCHTRIEHAPTVIGFVSQCAGGAALHNTVSNDVRTVTVCLDDGLDAADASSVALLYLPGAGNCSASVSDSFTYRAVAVTRPGGARFVDGAGAALASFVESALRGAWDSLDLAPLKYRLAASVISREVSVSLQLQALNDVPRLGTVAQPSVRLSSSGYIVTDVDVFEVDPTTQLHDEVFVVNMTMDPLDEQRQVTASSPHDTGVCLCAVRRVCLLACSCAAVRWLYSDHQRQRPPADGGGCVAPRRRPRGQRVQRDGCALLRHACCRERCSR